MEAIYFIITSFLVYLNEKQVQGLQPLAGIPSAKPLGFITYPGLLKQYLKYPVSQNVGQTFYSQEPNNFQNEGIYPNKDTAISNFEGPQEDLSNSPGIYVIHVLYQKLKHPRIFEYTNFGNLQMEHLRFWFYVTDVFTQMYAYKNPEEIAVFKSLNLMKHYEKLKSILPIFMEYIMNRWKYDLELRTSLRRVYNDLKMHKDLDFGTFLNYVVKQRQPPIGYPSLSFPTIDQESPNYNNAYIKGATGASASDYASNELGEKEIKEKVENNNLPISSEKHLIISSTRPLDPNCDLGVVSGTLISLLHNPDISQEKDNLEKLFKVIKTYSLSLGVNNPSFGDVVTSVERDLLTPKPEKATREARNQGFLYGWNIFLHEYNKGQLRQLIMDIQAGREKDEKVVVKKLTAVFLKLKLILRASRLSEQVINLVLKQALMTSLGEISSFVYEQCKRTSLLRFSQILETALNITPQQPIFPPTMPYSGTEQT